jgi:hypothetical protein
MSVVAVAPRFAFNNLVRLPYLRTHKPVVVVADGHSGKQATSDEWKAQHGPGGT